MRLAAHQAWRLIAKDEEEEDRVDYVPAVKYNGY